MIIFINIVLLWANIIRESPLAAGELPRAPLSEVIILTTARLPITDNYILFEIYQESDDSKIVHDKLDELTKWLQAAPQYDAWILSYAGNRACVAEAKRRGEIAKGYLIKKGVIPKHIKVVDAGFHEEWAVELWVVIRGTPGPPPRPSVKPKDVQIINRSEKQRCKSPKPQI
jgi:hypothetical protein